MVKISEIGILADDLTGACDVAGCFAHFTGRVSVLVSGKDCSFGCSPGLEVINTQSRLMTAEKSRTLLKSLGGKLASKKVIFKKIDTALRGPVGAELEGLIEAIGPHRIVVAPAFPSIGRTTSAGIQYSCGIPIHEDEFSRDPDTPVESANISEVIQKTGKVKFSVRDAKTEEDLLDIVDECLRDRDIVFVGSLGLAGALVQRIEKTKVQRLDIPQASRSMIVCGSQYNKVLLQVDRAVVKRGVRLVTFSPSEIFGSEEISIEMETPLIMRIDSRDCEPGAYKPSEVMSGFINTVVQVIEKVKPDGLGIVGGETAYHLMDCLGCSRIDIKGRIDDIIAFGVMRDGAMAGCPIVTKGGSVGNDDAIVRMWEHLMNPEVVNC